jgi:NAD-dependent SIR2 family protein deacetylase
MEDFKNRCFVCKEEIDQDKIKRNSTVNLPVCENCNGTDKEKDMEEEYLDSLADGLICGCI